MSSQSNVVENSFINAINIPKKIPKNNEPAITSFLFKEGFVVEFINFTTGVGSFFNKR